MLRRKSSTILLLTADQIVRADLSGGRVSAIWQQPRPAVDDLPMLVDSALRLGGKCRRRVWILTTDLWSQTVPIESGATRGASQEELAQALAFEAEPLSGISAFESVIGHKALQSDGFHRHFWVIQMPSWQMEQIDETIRQHGGTLGGVAHPGGLPRGVSGQGVAAAWRRVELWPDSVVAVQSSAGKSPEVQVISVSPAQDSWKAAVEKGFGPKAAADQRVLMVSRASDVQYGLGDETELLDLHDEAALKSWLAAWGESLGFRELGVPIIQPAAEPMSAQSQVVISAALATLVAAGCWALHTASQGQLTATAGDIKQLEERAEEFAAFDGEIKQRTDRLKSRSDENRQLLAALDTYDRAIAAQKQRFAVLLSSVAEQRPEHLMIRKIEQRDGTLTITGVNLDPESANELAVRLDQHVGPLGWRVGLPQQQAGKYAADRKPWTFKMQLTNIDITEQPPGVIDEPVVQPVARRLPRGRSDRE